MGEVNISKDLYGRIIVSFPYDPLIVEKVKTIEGRRWHHVEKHRSFPNTEDTFEKILKVFRDNEVQIDPSLKTAASKVNPVRNSSVTLTSAGIILKYNHSAKQQSIISNGVKYTPSPHVGEEATVPDLRTTYPYPPHRWGRERVGVKKLESGLSSKFDFEDLRKELVSNGNVEMVEMGSKLHYTLCRKKRNPRTGR